MSSDTISFLFRFVLHSTLLHKFSMTFISSCADVYSIIFSYDLPVSIYLTVFAEMQRFFYSSKPMSNNGEMNIIIVSFNSSEIPLSHTIESGNVSTGNNKIINKTKYAKRSVHVIKPKMAC